MNEEKVPALAQAGFAIAVMGGLLAMAPPLADAYVMPKWLAIAAGGAVAWAGLRRARVRGTALDAPLAALWVLMLVSTARSADPPSSVFGMYPQAFYGLLPLFLCAALYDAAAQAYEGERGEALLGLLVLASIPLAGYGIVQRVFGDVLTGEPLQSLRVSSTIGSPVMLGACLVALLPLALHRALEKRDAAGRLATVLIAAALVLTWSRGAWLCAAIGVGAYLQWTGRLRLSRRHLLAGAVLAPLVFFVSQRALRKRASDMIRVESHKTALAAFEAKPWLGFGPDAFQIAFRRYRTDEMLRLNGLTSIIQSSAHDDLSQVAVTLGLAGLAAYLWLLWALGRRLYVLVSRPGGNARAAALSAGLLGLFVQAKFNPIPASGLLLAALMAGAVCGGRRALAPAAGRPLAALAASLCLAAAVLYGRFCKADALFKTGGRYVAAAPLSDPRFMEGVNDLRRATELDPWRIDYLSGRCDVIFRVSGVAPPEQGRQLIDKALALTADGVRLHPGNPTAHELRATALALASRYGAKSLPEALAEIKKASELDPAFVFTLQRRMDIARALGDRAEFEAARAQYQRVLSLTHEKPDWTPFL